MFVFLDELFQGFFQDVMPLDQSVFAILWCKSFRVEKQAGVLACVKANVFPMKIVHRILRIVTEIFRKIKRTAQSSEYFMKHVGAGRLFHFFFHPLGQDIWNSLDEQYGVIIVSVGALAQRVKLRKIPSKDFIEGIIPF